MKLLSSCLILIFGIFSCEAAINFRETYFLRHCNDTKGEGAALLYLLSENKFSICAETYIDVKKFISEFQQSKEDGDTKNFFKTYCSNITSMRKCWEELSNGVDICFNDKEKKAKLTMVHLFNSMGEIICENEGETLTTFFDNGGMECIEKDMNFFQGCLRNTLWPFQFLSSVGDVLRITISKNECLAIEDLHSCAVERLKLCDKPIIAELFDKAMKALKKTSPCFNIVL